MSTFAQVGDFCSNTACSDHGKPQSEHQQNIIKFGKTHAGRQRFKCKTCGNTFTQTKGTIFYRRRTPENEIIETLALIAEGSRISSLARVKGHKEDTIIAWIRDAAEHCRRSNNMRMDVW
jgi:transposase-like protein